MGVRDRLVLEGGYGFAYLGGCHVGERGGLERQEVQDVGIR